MEYLLLYTHSTAPNSWPPSSCVAVCLTLLHTHSYTHTHTHTNSWVLLCHWSKPKNIAWDLRTSHIPDIAAGSGSEIWRRPSGLVTHVNPNSWKKDKKNVQRAGEKKKNTKSPLLTKWFQHESVIASHHISLDWRLERKCMLISYTKNCPPWGYIHVSVYSGSLCRPDLTHCPQVKSTNLYGLICRADIKRKFPAFAPFRNNRFYFQLRARSGGERHLFLLPVSCAAPHLDVCIILFVYRTLKNSWLDHDSKRSEWGYNTRKMGHEIKLIT